MLFQEVVVRMKLYMIENFDTYIEGGSFLRAAWEFYVVLKF